MNIDDTNLHHILQVRGWPCVVEPRSL